MSYVLTIYRAVSGELGQRQVVRVERKHPEISESPREEFCQALPILLGKAGHRDVLKVQAIFPGKPGFLACYLLENLRGVVRNDLDVVHVIGRAIQVVTHCNDEASEAVKLDRSWQLAVYFREKLEPGRS
jgi:hypothetical protein